MSRFDFLHPVLIDLKAKHQAEIDALKAKLEAAERDLAHALKVASVAEGMANETMVRCKRETDVLLLGLERILLLEEEEVANEAQIIARQFMHNYLGKK